MFLPLLCFIGNIYICTLEFSIFVEVLDNIFEHNRDCDFSGALFYCVPPATILAERSFHVIMWSSETIPQDAHTNFVHVEDFR